MLAGPGLPELIVFDVDGTLQDTGQWWPGVIAQGVERYGAAIGRSLPVPAPEAANAVLGHKDEQVWGPFLPADLQARWKELREVTVPIEVAVLRSGKDWLFPGTREVLRELRAAGVKLALASNCRSRYFAAVCDGQGLGALVDAAFCLDSPGVTTKRDMVRLAMAQMASRRAVMIGDRAVDLDAATWNGIPFVLRHGPHDGEVRAPAAAIGSSQELLPLLAGRAGFLRALVDRLAATRAPDGRPPRVGITGPPCAGKTELMRELMPLLGGWRGVALDSFLRPGHPVVTAASGDHLGAAFDLGQMTAALAPVTAPVVLEGVFLLDPRIRPLLDSLVFVDAPDTELLVRAGGRSRGSVDQLREQFLPAHRQFAARHPPDRLAHILIDNGNVLKPRMVR